MDIIPFEERAKYNGQTVRVIGSSLTGMTGTIIPGKRLPWVDEERRPYSTVPVLMHEPIEFKSNIAYLGVAKLEIIER